MAYYGALEIVDRAGWTRTYPLEKALLLAGSADFNDIVLPEERGLGVAPAHLQIMRPAAEMGSIRVVNLSTAPLPLYRRGQLAEALPGGGSADLEDADGLQLGDFRLAFSLQAQGGVMKSVRSEHLGLKLELPGAVLRPNKQLAGRLTVTNYGSQPRCQFELELEGLPGDCVRMDPAPLLFPHGEGQLALRFFHRGSRPHGGTLSLVLRATAPGAYPMEEVALEWTLEVASLQSFELSLDDDPQAPWERVAAARPAEKYEPMPRYAAQPASVAAPAVPSNIEQETGDFALSAQEDAPQPALDLDLAQLLPSATPASAHPADADWWEAGSTPGESIPAPRNGSTRRPHPRLNGKNISVIRAAPQQDPGSGPAGDPFITPEEDGQE